MAEIPDSFRLPSTQGDVDLPDKKKIVWRTLDGEPYTMNELTDSHLCNIIKHLKRRLIKARAELSKGVVGDPELFDEENKIHVYIQASKYDVISEHETVIEQFEAEAQRRSIKEERYGLD